jgi:predicted DNA-binding protein
MPASRSLARTDAPIARTIRFPPRVRERIAADAERCGRSFEAQVIAILRRHYGEDVDIAPAADTILSLARGSVAGMSREDQRLVTRRLVADDET